MKTEILERIFLDAGCAFPIRQASRSRSMGETVKSSVVLEVIETLKRDELGVKKKVKTARQKCWNFLRGNPSSVNKAALEKLRILFEFFQHKFLLSSPILFVCV